MTVLYNRIINALVLRSDQVLGELNIEQEGFAGRSDVE